MKLNFENQVALVTGAASGMGLAAAKAYAMAEMMKEVPMRRLGRAEEVADAVIWLCSPASSFIIGHALPVDGGYTVR
ncbi:SDR family oxidoreductase [Serratia sp. M24T3]|uniref:SDR family oxidoreductase n=1 Tax=Serratia sp. M24T3 TaxID=932213 RepID=UPI00025B90B9|nr:SDR family oxidoreductase [Serratia sp. M24T3]EIC84978.1 short-chain dehydrogenase/reductase SDR [Serratia sp. M24T3]